MADQYPIDFNDRAFNDRAVNERDERATTADRSRGDSVVSYAEDAVGEARSWQDAYPSTLDFDDGLTVGLTDEALADRIRYALSGDHMLDASRIHVRVAERGVTLSGFVVDASDQALAGLIARRQPGVSRLQNTLAIKPLDKADFSPEGSDHALTSSERFAALRDPRDG